MLHTFHIPVMGLGFTLETPIKVARFGISSVMSIVEDQLVEAMRQYHTERLGLPFTPIRQNETDARARRITAYLNLVHQIVEDQMQVLRHEPFEEGNEIVKYFELLPGESELKQAYYHMKALSGEEQKSAQDALRKQIQPGAIDVNIMAKVDKNNYARNGEMLPAEYSDALASLRGFAQSTLTSSVVFSAGYNPRLYSYLDQHGDFYPNEAGYLKKRVILKVSDFRSALTQGKILAKKGIWISEYRIESGLNCGGHAFATDGLLLGPILEEFKAKKADMLTELHVMCNKALAERGLPVFTHIPKTAVTVQGGIGTAREDAFLRTYYQVDGTGWGSPFLLVPEATTIDVPTLNALATAEKEDFYVSHASPLGVPFNNFRKTTSAKQLEARIAKGKPGSPCYKQFLSTNTEFTEKPICTSSRQYLHAKFKQLESLNLPEETLQAEKAKLTEKDCLCEGLGAGTLLRNGITPAYNLVASLVCPGPNLAYFSGIFSLREMVDHIYGRAQALNTRERAHMFINELELYVEHFQRELEASLDELNTKKIRYFNTFKNNLFSGIAYYRDTLAAHLPDSEEVKQSFRTALRQFEQQLESITIGEPVAA
ncbi:MAG TPA: hypothetical protein PLO56_08660 [Rhodothermales bacterium]|nr:hypothetical protein [Rhodothermales bacterium]